jgi:hypothetical protein
MRRENNRDRSTSPGHWRSLWLTGGTLRDSVCMTDLVPSEIVCFDNLHVTDLVTWKLGFVDHFLFTVTVWQDSTLIQASRASIVFVFSTHIARVHLPRRFFICSCRHGSSSSPTFLTTYSHLWHRHFHPHCYALCSVRLISAMFLMTELQVRVLSGVSQPLKILDWW